MNTIKRIIASLPIINKILYWKHIAKIYETAYQTRSSKVSFSQSGEDLIINYIFDSLGIQNPSYIDIGAFNPYLLSNTAFFYLKGSRGINIEPSPLLYQNFLKHRPEDINLNIGVGSIAGEFPFFVMSAETLNTFSESEAREYQKIKGVELKEIKKIPVETLPDILKKYCSKKHPDFISIDVEGHDFEIIKSIDFSLYAPTVICVESITYSQTGNGIKNEEMLRYVESNGYLLYADTNINSIFVKADVWKR